MHGAITDDIINDVIAHWAFQEEDSCTLENSNVVHGAITDDIMMQSRRTAAL